MRWMSPSFGLKCLILKCFRSATGCCETGRVRKPGHSSLRPAAKENASLKENQRRYFESLDMVRGLAALVVLIYHVDFMFGLRHWLLHGGYLAVDLFFVLSGFVLSFTYGRGIADGSLGIRKYAVARIAHLFPLFLATTC